MNVFLVMVALASPVEAPKAGLQEAAAAPAAVASEAVLPEARAVSAAETPPPQLAASGGADVPSAQIVKAAIPQRIGVWPEPRSNTDCNLADLYHRRFLSGPWSVTRRLEAARLRGNTEEVERLTAMLEEIVGEALEVEGMEQ